MKHVHKNISIVFVVLAAIVFAFVGCSDMLIQMGEVVLQIEAENTIRTSVATYSVSGHLENSKSPSFQRDNLKPLEDVIIPNMAPGKWTFTVTAYNEKDEPIGNGTKEIVLVEGQKVDLKIFVVFDPIQLKIPKQLQLDQVINKVYDGNTAVLVNGEETFAVDASELIGLHSVDGVDDTVRIEAKATYDDKNIGTHDITVTYTLVYTDDLEIDGKYTAPEPYTVSGGVITKKPLTIKAPTFPDSKNKVYDGNDTLSVTAGSLIGVVPGDEVIVSAMAKYGDSDVGDNKSITVTYSLSGKDAANYTKLVDDTIKTGKITPKPLTFTMQSHDKIFDGNDSATGTISLVGVVGSDEVSATCSFCFSDIHIGSDKTVNVSGIVLEGTKAGNYSLATDHATSTATISKATYNMDGVIFAGKNLTYDGSAHSLSIGGTLPEGVSVTYTNNTKNRDAGSFEVTAIFSGDVANYEPIADMKAILSIEKKALTIEGTYLSPSKIYDKTRTAQVSIEQDKSGKIAGDDMMLLVDASYDSASVDMEKSIVISYSLHGTDAKNYSKPSDYTVNEGVVTPIQLTLDKPTFSSISKNYDGTTRLETSEVTPNGVMEGETVSVKAIATYEDKSAGKSKVIQVTYELDGLHAENYLAPSEYTIYSGSISPIQLHIDEPSFPTPNSKTYDGSDSAFFTKGEVSGVIPGDDVLVDGTGNYATKDVGSSAIAVAYNLSGKDAINYIAPPSTTGTIGTITKKALTVKGGTTQVTTEKLFDYTSDAEVIASGELVWIVGDEDVVLKAVASFDSATTHANKTITVEYSLGGNDAGNYTAPDAKVFTGSILTGQLTISDPALAKSKIYTSSPDCIVYPGDTIGGILASDSVQVLATATYDSKYVGTGKIITVVYSLAGADADKYTAPETYVATDGEIQKKLLTITKPKVPSISKQYDGTTSVEFTPGTVSGLYTSDDVSVVANGFYLSPTIEHGKKIFFTYSLEGSDAGNYTRPEYDEISSAVITKKALLVEEGSTLVVSSKIYDRNASATIFAPGKLVGIVGSDEVILKATAAYPDANAGTDKDIVVTYTISGEDAEKYTAPASLIVSDATIRQKPLHLASKTIYKTYDGKTTTRANLPLDGVLGVDDVRVSGTFTFDDVHASETPQIVSVTDIQLEGSKKGNYSLSATATSAQVMIRKAALNATVGDYSKMYSEENPLFALVVEGFVNGEDAFSAHGYIAPIVSTPATVSTGAGTSPITITGGSATNYSFNTADTGILTIGKKPLMVTGTTVTNEKVYDGNAAVVVSHMGKLGGIVGDDVVKLLSSAAYENEIAGLGKTILISYMLDGSDASNYTAPVDEIKSGSIRRKQLTAIGTTVDTEKIYDGNVTAIISHLGTLNSKVSDDVVNLIASAVYNSKAVASGKSITVSYTLDGSDAANYVAPADCTYETGVITEKPLTISAPSFPDSTNKVYDGNDTLSVTAGSLIDVVEDDEVSVTAEAVYGDSDVGDNKSITVTYSLSGKDAANYTKPVDDTTKTGKITPKPLTFTVQAGDKKYDGNNSATGSIFLVGIVEPDAVSATGAFAFGDADASESVKTVFVTDIKLEGS